MPKVSEISNEKGSYIFQCPGCGYAHKINTVKRDDGWPVWGFNHNLESPTVTPSILVTYDHGENYEKKVCHSFVKDGKIQFLSDCTHKLAGQTVELPEI